MSLPWGEHANSTQKRSSWGLNRDFLATRQNANHSSTVIQQHHVTIATQQLQGKIWAVF